LTNYDAVSTHVDTTVGELQRRAVFNTAFLVNYCPEYVLNICGLECFRYCYVCMAY